VLGTVIPGATSPSSREPACEPTLPDLTDAVRGAALFALLLALQGLDEAMITRVIDQTVGREEALIDGPDAARPWLEELTERFEQTLAMELGA
jgi:hypothetical protein